MSNLRKALVGFTVGLFLFGGLAVAQVVTGAGINWPLLASDGATVAPSYAFASEPTMGFYRSASGVTQWAVGSAANYGFDNTAIRLRSTRLVGWSSTTAPSGTLDTSLARRAAGVVASNGALATATTTVTGLPAAATAGAGARHFVTDALTPTFGSTVVGGGAVGIPVVSNGAAWIVG